MVDHTGPFESSTRYAYIRDDAEMAFEKICRTMPEELKDCGFPEVFRNLIVAPLYYHRILNVFIEGKDEVMTRRVDATMGSSLWYLSRKVLAVWVRKICRDARINLLRWFRRVKWHNNGVDVSVIRDLVAKSEFDCIVFSNKFVRVLTKLRAQAAGSLCAGGLKPLFVLVSDRYAVEKMENGCIIVEIPFHNSVFPSYSPAERRLFAEARRWARHLDAPGLVRYKIAKIIREHFLAFSYFRKIADGIFEAGKAKCLLTFSEGGIEARTFILQARSRGIPTVYYHHFDGLQQLIYKKYMSAHVLVSNRVQYGHFMRAGYAPQQCHMIGSFSFAAMKGREPNDGIKPRRDQCRIMYFTKGTKSVDETILTQIIEKLQEIGEGYSLIIKKHPRDANRYIKFLNARTTVTSAIDYADLVQKSDLIVTQYGSVVLQLIPLRIPLILYTLSDLKEYGEREYFSKAALPNYLRYAQNKKEFQGAVGNLSKLTESDPLPSGLAEDLYGYTDDQCGARLSNVIASLVREDVFLPGSGARQEAELEKTYKA